MLSNSLAKELYALTKYEGDPVTVKNYAQVVEELKLMDTLGGLAKVPIEHRKMYELCLEFTNEGLIKREGFFYSDLNYLDLAIYLEVNGGANYMIKIDWALRYSLLSNMMHEPTVSMDLKLALACRHESAICISYWLFEENNGAYLEPFLKFYTRYIKPEKVERHKELTFIHVLSIMLNSMSAPEDLDICNIIKALKAEVIDETKLSLILKTLNDFGYFIAGSLAEAMAFHARRLYDFDDSIPDEWVMHAIGYSS